MSSVERVEKAVEQQEYLCSDANDDMAAEIVSLKKYLSSSLTDFQTGLTIPRFGLLSLKAAGTPMYVYDHPAFMKITNTAFTDGVHIFVAADFLRQLVKEEEETKGAEDGALPLMLHELMHMLLGHTHRLKMFPRDIANQATDLVINAKLQIGYETIKWSKTIRELGLGFKAGEAEKFMMLSEETVARKLIAGEIKPKKKKNDKKGQNGQNGQNQGQGQGQSSGGNQQGDSNSSGENQEQGQREQEQGQGEQEQEWSDQHTITLEDLIKVLEKEGLTSILDALQLPASDKLDEIAKIEENTLLKDIENIEKAAAQKSACNGKYPGAHIVDAASERIKGLTDGKLDWKLGMREWVLGGGMRFKMFEDEADALYYIDGKDMGLSDPIYVGSPVPHSPEETVLCLIDTSGSVDDKMLKSFISEILNLKRGVSGVTDTASEVVILSADTVLRGEAIEVTDENVDELLEQGVKIFGRGGTDLAGSLDMAMNLDLIKKKKITSVIYFTDLCDIPPPKSRFDKYLEKGMTFAYVTAPSTMSDEFAKAVKDYARVYPIVEGMVIDMTEEALSSPVNTRGSKLK